jgi:hypothetical protein
VTFLALLFPNKFEVIASIMKNLFNGRIEHNLLDELSDSEGCSKTSKTETCSAIVSSA